MTKQNVTNQLLQLIADEQFVRIESLATRPNLFRIVGRTYTETWHSMFLGWLLDPNGSHRLKDFSLKRLLVAITDPVIIGGQAELNRIARVASIGELDSALVQPNEDQQTEYPCEAGRIDVFVEKITCEKESETVILIEQKVNAPIDKEQCKRYADWLYEKYPQHLKIPLLIAPGDRLGGSSEETVDDPRWYGIDYQVLHDKILAPIIRHPGLSQQTAPLIEQYIDALRVPTNGRKLAVTDEEKELALELLDKHRVAFEAISAALADTTDLNLVPSTSTKTKMVLKINGDTISGDSVPELYQAALKYIVDNGLPVEDKIPYATSSKRYLIAKAPVHQENNEFRMPVEYSGFYMEAHKSRLQAVKDIARLLKKLGCNVEIVE